MEDCYYLDWCHASKHYFNSAEEIREYVLEIWDDLSEKEKEQCRIYKDWHVKVFEVKSKDITKKLFNKKDFQ